MIAPPTFASHQEHVALFGNTEFWWPYVREILRRHSLPDAGHALVAGHNGSYPTFLYRDVVIKLFGYSRAWQARHAAERAAYTLLATDAEIAAPRVIGEGRLYDDGAAAWPYLLTSRMPGVAIERADFSAEQERAVVAEVGRQVRRIHALPPSGVPSHADWATVSIAEAAAWPIGTDFPLRALRFALHRQAVGLAQHNAIDVFMPIAAKYPLREIATLDELATLLFDFSPDTTPA